MNLKVEREIELSSPTLIGLKTQILDLESMQLLDYHPKYVISNTIPYDYNPNAYDPIVDKTLDKLACGDKQIRTLFEEMVGYSLYRKNLMQQCFILTGEGSNGKSTALNMIKKLLGKGNYSSLDMRELEDTFKPAELHGKLANIGDDISAKYMDNSSVFKKVVTGESFVVQRKYAQPFELESYATQIFCANELPRVQDKSDGFSRRINIIPFNAKFSKHDPDFDPFIEDKLLADGAMEYLLKLAIEGLRRVLLNRQFTVSTKGEQEKSDYKIHNNSVLDWIYNGDPKIENESSTDVYLQYKIYCGENGEVAMKKGNMTSIIKRELGFDVAVKRVEGKSTRVFVKES
jgi:putative DNA primase/helicase